MTTTHEEVQADGVRIYEVGYLLLPSIPEENVPEHVTALKSIVSGAGGTVISEEDPAPRRLAYEIGKRIGTKNEHFRSACFGWMKFEVEGEKLPEIKEKLDALDALLRFLIVKTVREDTYVPRTREKEAVSEENTPSESSGTEEAEPIDNQSAEE